eukprot:312677_1
MAKAFYAYFQKQQNQNDISKSSIDDLKMQDAVPIVRKTWGELMKNKEEVGAKIYDSILNKEITMSRLFMETNIEQQSGLFMVMMDKVVGFLDDPVTMDDKLMKMGDIHVQQYKIKTKHFKHFKSAFMKAIKRYLPWSDRREHAWQWFWNKTINAMSSATQANHFPLMTEFNGRHITPDDMVEFATNIHLTFDVALQSDPQGFAVEFYKTLLQQEPDIASLFSKSSMEEQAVRFISMLNHSIKLLDDTSTFGNKLEKLAAVHVEYGVEVNQLASFGDVLVRKTKELNMKLYNKKLNKNDSDNKDDFMELDILSVPKWTEKHDEAWKWFWKVVVGVFSSGMTAKINEKKK